METTKTMTEPMSFNDAIVLSLCAARPILGDQVASLKGTGVSGSVSASGARVLGGVPAMKFGTDGAMGTRRLVRDRAIATTPIFADGVGRSVTWRPPV